MARRTVLVTKTAEGDLVSLVPPGTDVNHANAIPTIPLALVKDMGFITPKFVLKPGVPAELIPQIQQDYWAAKLA